MFCNDCQKLSQNARFFNLKRRFNVPFFFFFFLAKSLNTLDALPHNSLQSLSVRFAADAYAALPELASSVTQDVVLHRNPKILFHSL